MKSIISILLVFISISAFGQQKVRPEKKIVKDSLFLSIKMDEELGDTVFYENRDITYSSGEKTFASQFAGAFGQPINYKDTLELLTWYGSNYISAHDRVALALREFYNASKGLNNPRDFNKAVRNSNIIPVQVFVERNIVSTFVDIPFIPDIMDTTQVTQTVFDSTTNTNKDTLVTVITSRPSTANLSPGTRYRLKIGENAFVNHTMHVNRNSNIVLRTSSVTMPVNLHSTKCLSVQINGVWQMLFNIEEDFFESLDRSIKLQKL